ncbi:MAG: hypothetical protein WC207_05695 [Sphaerochaetaceae bacterium]
MKKVALFIVMALVVLTLTSCIEVIHVITIANGVVSTQIRYTAQKYLFDMLSLFSTDGVNASDVFDIGEEIFEDIPEGFASLRKIDSPYDFGAEITIISSYDDDVPFVPHKVGDYFIVTLPSLGGDEMDEDTIDFLSGTKYRMILSLTDVLSDIRHAEVYVGDDYLLGEDDGVNVIIQDKLMVVEIPMVLLFMGEEDYMVILY